MMRRLPSWPVLLVWLAFSVPIYWVAAGFGGSFNFLAWAPPIGQYPVEFLFWFAEMCLFFAPVVLIPARLLSDLLNRGPNAQDR